MPVSAFVTVTATPGSTAPVVSRTVPVMDPLTAVDWAKEGRADTKTTARAAMKRGMRMGPPDRRVGRPAVAEYPARPETGSSAGRDQRFGWGGWFRVGAGNRSRRLFRPANVGV